MPPRIGDNVTPDPTVEPEPLHAAKQALSTGNLLLAYDVATTALKNGAAQPRLRYFQILALARMGEIDRAQALYERYLSDETDLDTLALRARLLKDTAWHRGDPDQPRLLAEASTLYETLFERTGDAFPAINAATLAFLSGERERSQRLAHRTLAAIGSDAPGDYYTAATVAEARLLLGEESAAVRAIGLALTLPGADQGARSSTSRQLQRIAQASGHGAALIARLRPPPVLTYSGHMFGADSAREATLSAEVRALLAETGSSIAYGALACGADITIAEAILKRGGELNVILPYLAEDFVRTSVVPGGDGWVARFERCMAQAAEVVIASETHALSDDRQFKYASMLMMGYARLRARHLDTEAIQLAIWDEHPTAGNAGTAADVRLWREHGGTSRIIHFDRTDRPRAPSSDRPAITAPRKVRGMIFADFAGFSRIDEVALPEFWEKVLVRVASVIDRYDAEVCSRNTWGDAIYVVTRSAVGAAELALDLQMEMAPAKLASFGATAGLRVSAHLGTVYQAVDPVTRQTTFFGREVNRTARIEPIASVGEVYVTRAFGAVLAMEAPDRFDLSYVGRVALAKKSGEEAMYRLTRGRTGQAAP